MLYGWVGLRILMSSYSRPESEVAWFSVGQQISPLISLPATLLRPAVSKSFPKVEERIYKPMVSFASIRTIASW